MIQICSHNTYLRIRNAEEEEQKEEEKEREMKSLQRNYNNNA